jgi:hypothetical protein
MSHRHPKRTLSLLGLASALLCSACATTTHGAWYHQSDDGIDSLYFAFVYAGEKDTLARVAINEKEFDGWDCARKPGTTDRGDNGHERAIVPGQLIVLWLPHDDKWKCKIVVPTSAKAKLETRNSWKDDVDINVSTALPSALPESWLDCRDEPEKPSIELQAAKKAKERSNMAASFLSCTPRIPGRTAPQELGNTRIAPINK